MPEEGRFWGWGGAAAPIDSRGACYRLTPECLVPAAAATALRPAELPLRFRLAGALQRSLLLA